MKLKLLPTNLGLSFLALTSSITSSYAQENSNVTPYTFSCEARTNAITGEKNPTTVARTPEKKYPVQFIVWKSRYFQGSGWTRQKRCEKVSRRIQEALDSGRKYIVSGQVGPYPIICAVDSVNKPCDKNYQLFQLEIGSNVEITLQRIMDIQAGATSAPIFQSSGDKKYFNIYKILKNAPVLQEE
jgi:hypothetical protein